MPNSLIESAKVQLFFYLTTLPYGFVKKNTPCTVSAVLLCVKILPNKTISPPNQDNTSQNRQHIHRNPINIFNIRYCLLSEIGKAPSWQKQPVVRQARRSNNNTLTVSIICQRNPNYGQVLILQHMHKICRIT